jgi:hypothetical protein
MPTEHQILAASWQRIQRAIRQAARRYRLLALEVDRLERDVWNDYRDAIARGAAPRAFKLVLSFYLRGSHGAVSVRHRLFTGADVAAFAPTSTRIH